RWCSRRTLPFKTAILAPLARRANPVSLGWQLAPHELVSVVEQSPDKLGAILPEHEDHAHQALAGDPAGRHRERELGRQLGLLPFEPPAEDTTDAKQQPVVPVEGPREAHAGRGRDEMPVLRQDPREQSEDQTD